MIAVLLSRSDFCLLLVATITMGISTGKAAPPQKPLPAIDRRDEEIESKLTQPTEADFVDVPLEIAIDHLNDLHQLTMKIDGKALEKAKIKADVPVTVKVKDAPLAKALDRMLLPLKLNYMVKDHILTISTVEAVAAWKKSRIKKPEK
jgi:hypothetical protein